MTHQKVWDAMPPQAGTVPPANLRPVLDRARLLARSGVTPMTATILAGMAEPRSIRDEACDWVYDHGLFV